MRSKLHRAGIIAGAASFLTILFSAEGVGAIAQDAPLAQPAAEPAAGQEPAEQAQAPATAMATDAPAAADSGFTVPAATTLAALVSSHGKPETLSPEMRCLAGAIYFEAKSESLPGQLAVGRVVINRARSGRFPASYCGVVYQPSQFSFIRGHAMPAINTASQDWREAVAIAQIADANAWRSPAEGALFFHATHVSPRWRLTRVARVENHIFYR